MSEPINTYHSQLTEKFTIPGYAQDMLYVVSADGSAPTQGPKGQFSLPASPSGLLRIVWGTADGPTLAVWKVEPEHTNLRWDGSVKVGGFVERLHARKIAGLEFVIIEV